eukprot:m51a1_g843 putative rotein disulfide-isomerase (410) ;mRNA; f:767980-769527
MRAIVVAAMMAAGALALYDASGPVILLNKNTFKNVFSDDNVWVVEFFAPWCGHCKALAPEYLKAAENLKGIVKVAAVDCDAEKEVCGAFQVQGFPTVKMFPSELTKQDKGFTKVPRDYQGPRTAASIATEAVSMLPDRTVKLTSANEAKFFEHKNVAKAVLFSEKDSAPTMWKALALEYGRGMAFARVSKKETELATKFHVTKFPTVVVVPTEGEPVVYSGAVKVAPLAKFLAPYFKAQQGQGKGSQGQQEQEAPKQSWELARITTAAGFKEHCLDSRVLCAISVLDPYNFPGEQSAHESTLQQLADRFKGRTRFVWLGQREQPELVRTFDMRSGFPALVVVRPGASLRYTKFVGAFDVDSIANFLDAVLHGRKGFLELDKAPVVHDINPDDFKAPPPVEEEDVAKEEL